MHKHGKLPPNGPPPHSHNGGSSGKPGKGYVAVPQKNGKPSDRGQSMRSTRGPHGGSSSKPSGRSGGKPSDRGQSMRSTRATGNGSSSKQSGRTGGKPSDRGQSMRSTRGPQKGHGQGHGKTNENSSKQAGRGDPRDRGARGANRRPQRGPSKNQNGAPPQKGKKPELKVVLPNGTQMWDRGGRPPSIKDLQQAGELPVMGGGLLREIKNARATIRLNHVNIAEINKFAGQVLD